MGMGETMPPYVWAAMPFVIAAGAAMLTAILMHARMDAALARQREGLYEVRALLATQRRAMEERIRATEQEARRQALDDFLADVRVEERRFLQEGRRVVLIEERVSFRNIPLTPWVEHEVPAGTPIDSAPSRAEPVRIAAVRSPRLLR
jgi:hypothetical protein